MNTEAVVAKDAWKHHPMYRRYWTQYNHLHRWFAAHNRYIQGHHLPAGHDPAEASNWTASSASCVTTPTDISDNTNINNCTSSNCTSSARTYTRQQQSNGRPKRSRSSSPSSSELLHDNLSHLHGNSSHLHRNTRKRHSYTESMETSSEEEIEMVIPESMIEFMKVSAQHRKERDEAKRAFKKEQENVTYIDASMVTSSQKLSSRSSKAPSQRAGSERTQQMVRLYGPSAPSVHALEAAVQLQFDSQTDLLQPPYWPHIPLNITFT